MNTLHAEFPTTNTTTGSVYDCPINSQDAAIAEHYLREGDAATAEQINKEISDRQSTCAGAVLTYSGFSCCKQNGGVRL